MCKLFKLRQNIEINITWIIYKVVILLVGLQRPGRGHVFRLQAVQHRQSGSHRAVVHVCVGRRGSRADRRETLFQFALGARHAEGAKETKSNN